MPENRPISEEEKKMILKNTDKYRQQLEELEHELATETKEKESKTKQKPNVNLDDDPTKLLGPKKETVITKITDKQYDIKGEQKRLRRKKTYREYGYQRLYLLEKIKVSTMILMVILMILCIVLILRFFSLDMERYSRNLQETQTTMVCEDITTKLELLNSEGPLEVRLKIKNNSGKPICLNPNRLVLKDSTSDSFSLHGSGDKATQIIEDGKSATITMKYNTKNEAGFYIEAIFDDENLEEQCVQSIQIGGVVDV